MSIPIPSRLCTFGGALLAAAACGGGPPAELGGFELGLTQSEVLEAAGARGGFTCRLRSSRPKLATCEGPAEAGTVRVVVRDDSAVGVRLELDPAGAPDPRRAIRRFVKPFGAPAWRDRPYPPRATPPEGYHTLWLTRDSTRSVALVCAGRELQPPCTAELTGSSPARVQAQLDTLMGIRR